MKVMWPPNNKVNGSIKKSNSKRARKNCVSQRRKWKQCNANVFLNRKIQWIPIHLRGHCCLKFSFSLASATGFFFWSEHMNAIAVANEYVIFFPFPIVSSIRTFIRWNVRCVTFLYIQFTVYRDIEDEYMALSNDTAHTFLSCFCVSCLVHHYSAVLHVCPVHLHFLFYSNSLPGRWHLAGCYLQSNGTLSREETIISIFYWGKKSNLHEKSNSSHFACERNSVIRKIPSSQVTQLRVVSSSYSCYALKKCICHDGGSGVAIFCWKMYAYCKHACTASTHNAEHPKEKSKCI